MTSDTIQAGCQIFETITAAFLDRVNFRPLNRLSASLNRLLHASPTGSVRAVQSASTVGQCPVSSIQHTRS
jgi:hypothetical protein